MINFDQIQTYVKPDKPIVKIGFIYFLFHGQQLVYVGKTTNIHTRIHSHKTTKFFTSAKFYEHPVETLDEEEKRVIDHYSPVLNSRLYRRTGESFLEIDDYVHLSGNGSYKKVGNQLYDMAGRTDHLWNGRFTLYAVKRGWDELTLEGYDWLENKRLKVLYKTDHLKKGWQFEIDTQDLKINFFQKGKVPKDVSVYQLLF